VVRTWLPLNLAPPRILALIVLILRLAGEKLRHVGECSCDGPAFAGLRVRSTPSADVPRIAIAGPGPIVRSAVLRVPGGLAARALSSTVPLPVDPADPLTGARL